MNFIDLAGSENMNVHDSNPESTAPPGVVAIQKRERINEGQNINKSLFYLTQVISKLSKKKEAQAHIPFRNSTLTKLLRSSLGGNSKTAVVLCI